MGKFIRLKIGNVVIAAAADDFCPPFRLSPSHRPFLAGHPCNPDVALQVHYSKPPEVDFTEKVFECEGPWSLYRRDGQLLLAMASPVGGGPIDRLAILDQDLTSGEIYLDPSENPLSSDSAGAALTVEPFEYPLDEVLLINFLAHWRLGLIIHALGLIDSGKGLVFCGVSGAGKSTLARLWQKTEAALLSDDRLIVRPLDGRVIIYGTPWHGDAGIASPACAPLEKLYFISHSSRNQVSPLSASAAAARLLVRCFPPFYDRQGMANILELISEIVAGIPCYELGFAPDGSIVDFVREHHETG